MDIWRPIDNIGQIRVAERERNMAPHYRETEAVLRET